jgi:hypothetical protein
MLLLACVIVFTPWTVAEKPTRLLRRQLEDNGRPLFDEFVIVTNLIQEYEEDRFLEETFSMSINHCPASSDDESKAPGNPCSRLELARERSIDIIHQTFDSIEPVAHITNGDEVKYGADSEFPFIGNFHKTLPHKSNGLVDVDAYLMLVNECIENVNVTACSKVPGTGVLANSLGGYYLPAQGVPPWALVLPPPPSVDSAEMALMYAEVAWMALLRDVPFSEYADNPLAAEAAASLSDMAAQPDIDNVLYRRPLGQDGKIDPASQLFRLDFEGVTRGPMVSQFLFETFEYDGIVVEPKITTVVPDSDTMTTFEEFLCVQNGGADCFEPPERDPIPRYIRNARDLGFVSQRDRVTSIYVRAAFIKGILQPQISFYESVKRQEGFSTQGIPRIDYQIVSAAAGISPAWYSKWNVHRAVRPEGYGGLVDQTVSAEGTNFPVHPSILKNVVIERMVDKWGSALLPQMNTEGCPAHPSYPAGHAMIAGASVTVLKAYMDPDATRCYPFPIKEASPDGLSLNVVIADNSGSDCITVNGELNKLAHNLSLGRDMSGLHFRSDATSGILQGEAYAITYLQDDLDRQPECATLKFKSFQGNVIELSPRRKECQEAESITTSYLG